MRHVHIVSQYKGSINEITRDLVEGLSDNYIVTREGEDEPEEYDILLCHFINPNITKNDTFYKFRHRILIQPIDGTAIKRDIIEEINKFDIIITPGNAGKTILINGGVKKPIEVIPNYYKPDLLIPPVSIDIKKIRKHIKNKYVFYHESTAHPRKGLEEMLTAYVKTCSSDDYPKQVVFIIKTPEHNPMTFDSIEEIKKRISVLQSQYKYPAKIIRIAQWLSDEQLKQLWYRCDCYVHTARIEGFGIPLLRMMILGKPIITLDNNLCGYMDFLTPDKAAFVPCKTITAEGEINPMYTELSEWKIADSLELEMRFALRAMDRFKETQDFTISPNFFYEFKTVMNQYINLINKLDYEYKFIESKIELV